MAKLIATLVLSLALAAGLGSIAHGAPQCNERDNVHDMLGKKYGETTTAIGVTNTGGLVEVLTDPKDSSWTIIVTTPQGMSCLVAAGEGWRTKEEISRDPGA